MRHSIRKFIIRSLLATLPVFIFMGFYAVVDPFHVIHPIVTDAHGRDSVAVSNNAGVTSVETYLLHNDDCHYDSFILGSSMSQNFKASYWKPHLDSTASILHFDASSETLDGIINKIHFLNSHGTTIKNALIVIENEMLTREPTSDDMLFIQHPATTHASSWLKFHTLHFRAFLDFTQVAHALMPGKLKQEMQREGMLATFAPNRIGRLNEASYNAIDSLIAINPRLYFTPALLAKRKHAILPTVTAPAINEHVEAKLRLIKQLLDASNTHYIIIVPPCNNKPQLSAHDLWIMKTIFGQATVHNFSSHPELVFNEQVYYDNVGHLISAKCKILLDSAYFEQEHHAINSPYFNDMK